MTDDVGKPTGKVGVIVKADPVLRYSAAGKAFTKFSIQVKPFVPKGQPEVEPTYYDVTCFGSLAENVAECMKKGYRVGVIGKGKVEEWTNQGTGKSGTSNVILADFVGPDLRFAVADVRAIERSSAPRQGGAPAQPYTEEEEPF